MQLIKLSANKPSFHTVNFKPGFNIILGKKSNPDSNDLHKTFNGVGKSLVIQLIHFCFASDKIEDFTQKLPEWEFTLEFELNGKNYKVIRNTTNQGKILLNGEELSLDEYRKFLKKEAFGIQEDIGFLTFRSQIIRFIRPTKGSYLSFDKYISQEKDYGKYLNNSYLLGLDIKKSS